MVECITDAIKILSLRPKEKCINLKLKMSFLLQIVNNLKEIIERRFVGYVRHHISLDIIYIHTYAFA